MTSVRFIKGEQWPLEMHKVRIVQKLNLIPVEERVEAIKAAGNNTFLLQNRDVFMDMLTDSGVNAMSDRQMAAMMVADDSYAGSETFTRLADKLKELFGFEMFLPAHQGRACENIIARTMVKEGTFVPMNYHFTTTRAHIHLNGGKVVELITKKGLEIESSEPFKGNMDLEGLRELVEEKGKERIAFVRMEAGTNLIGGQPFSMENLEGVRKICDENGLSLVLDASLLADNLHFIKVREDAFRDSSIKEITMKMASLCDVVYFSARKLGCARGGGILVRDEGLFARMRELVPLYEGFLTYGGMSVREMEALTVGLDETMEEDMISQGPQFIQFMVDELQRRGVPVVTPGGGLGCHLNAMKFLPHIPQSEYPAGALASALYIAGGIRGMERGTISEDRDENQNEHMADMELLRLALPRRVFTLSQVMYVIDRITWLHENRDLVGGLTFTEEPRIMRFFLGKLKPVSSWQEKLMERFRADFGDSL
ncbi:MAG TPA: tryptophanase [Clostridiaceae bacterium]|nr:tryptophanase [Clostridiaceae bacterium]